MTLYSAKGGVETYHFHYTSNSDIPVVAICWNEGEEDGDQPVEIPSTADDTTNTTDDLVDQARELIKNFKGDTLNWLTALGGPGIAVAILSSMFDYAPNMRHVASAICACESISQLALAWFAYFLWPCPFDALRLCLLFCIKEPTSLF